MHRLALVSAPATVPDAPPSGTPLVEAPRVSGEVFSLLINLAGRRRFTSQRLILYALLAAQERPHALGEARSALTLFTDANLILMQGNAQVPGAVFPELHQVYEGASQGRNKIEAFMQGAQRALDAIERRSPAAPALLEQLVDAGTPLLAVLNQVTGVYEELAKRHARQTRQQLVDVMANLESIARQAKMVAFNAQIMAARAGQAGKEFAVVAGVLTEVTGQIDQLVGEAMKQAGL